jgi:hypothetical protein
MAKTILACAKSQRKEFTETFLFKSLMEDKNMLHVHRYFYDTKETTIEEAVFKAWLFYCLKFQEYPKVLYVPLQEAGFFTELLVCRIDRSLKHGEIVVSSTFRPDVNVSPCIPAEGGASLPGNGG